eukprot:PhF_6_TR19631/c0_g1_i2/m.28644
MGQSSFLALVCASVVIASCFVVGTNGILTNCGTSNMTSVFTVSSMSVTPTIPSRTLWNFSLAGDILQPLNNVQTIITSSLCIPTAGCIPVDTRVVNCANPVCNFPAKGNQIILTQQQIPSFTPAGTYMVILSYNAIVASASTTFACVQYNFTLT